MRPRLDILSHLREPFTAETLFDRLPDIVFFIKDEAGRYLIVNQTLVERTGKKDKSDVLGKTPSEVVGKTLGQSYEAQDQEVLRSGQPLYDRLELHAYRSQNTGWCMTNKLPLFDKQQQVIGVVGVSRDLRMPDMRSSDFASISAAVEFAESNLSDAPDNAMLADVAGMSAYQLDRRMQRVFGLTTGQWLLKTRISAARRLLIDTQAPIAQIALDVGYGDQSAFAKRFLRATGVTPSTYRRLKQASARE